MKLRLPRAGCQLSPSPRNSPGVPGTDWLTRYIHGHLLAHAGRRLVHSCSNSTGSWPSPLIIFRTLDLLSTFPCLKSHLRGGHTPCLILTRHQGDSLHGNHSAANSSSYHRPRAAGVTFSSGVTRRLGGMTYTTEEEEHRQNPRSRSHGPTFYSPMKPGASYPRSDVWHYVLICIMENTGLEQWMAVG